MAKKNTNPFKTMQGDLRDVPPQLRQKVMDDVAVAKLMMEMATLFTGNYSSLIEGMLKTSDKNQKK